ncbi:MAG: hypothetical protein P1P63_01290 [Treponemataceae bacterium]
MKTYHHYLAAKKTVGTVKGVDVVNRAIEIIEQTTEKSIMLYMDNAMCDKAIQAFFNPPPQFLHTFIYEGKVLKEFYKNNGGETK